MEHEQVLGKVNEILKDLETSLPKDSSIGITQSFIDDVTKSLSDPVKTFEETIKEFCNENVLNRTIETSTDPTNLTKMTVILDKANYGNYLYYRIICDRHCIDAFDMHPFVRLTDKCHKNVTEIKEVVADNEMIRKMFEFFVMSDADLRKVSGNTGPLCYRASIIESIILFWD